MQALCIYNNYIECYSLITNHTVYLSKVLLGYPDGPLLAQLEGAGGVGHVRALDQHTLDNATLLTLNNILQ